MHTTYFHVFPMKNYRNVLFNSTQKSTAFAEVTKSDKLAQRKNKIIYPVVHKYMYATKCN